MSDQYPDGGPTPLSKRPRAPTITIDTSADDPQHDTSRHAPNLSASPADHGLSPASLSDPQLNPWNNDNRDYLHRRRSDSRDSRPTSPHNVSSPANEKTQVYLSVPTNTRSRQNSVDSDDGSHSFTSQGETMYSNGSEAPSTHSAVFDQIMNDTDALRPDAGNESEFDVKDNPFAFSPGQLNKMFNPKSLAAFYLLGGLTGLERGLYTDRHAGLNIDEHKLPLKITVEGATNLKSENAALAAGSKTSHSHSAEPGDTELFVDRKRVFSDNRLPEKQGKTLLQLMWITYNDKVLILLSAAAVVSLAIGLYQTFGQEHHPDDPSVEWIEGVAIIAAILIVVLVGSINDYQKEHQFAKLNKKKQDRVVKATRSGKTVEISVYDILVGDVIHLEPGDLVPVDGVLIDSFNVQCDESQATGESDIIKKQSADAVYAAIENRTGNAKKLDPFIQSGSRVMEGMGTFLVTSTGVYSTYGKTLMSLDEDPEVTPLQSKLNAIAEWIAKIGGAAGLLLFIVLLIKFLVSLPHLDDLTPAEKGQRFLNIFIVVVTIIVVAIPEGLPLAVTLALAFATTRMLRDNNLVRRLKACEVMGNATTICSDKTGTLTQNKMQVVACVVGTMHRFGDVDTPDDDSGGMTEKDATPQGMVSRMSAPLKDLLVKSITLNSTAFEGEVDGQKNFIGSKTETALLLLARDFLAIGSVNEERANAKTLQLIPFDSVRKCMGIVVQQPGGRARLYVKGASEIMLAKCTDVVADYGGDLSLVPLTDDKRDKFSRVIETYATHSLRTIGLLYRDFEQWPPRGVKRAVDGDKDEVDFDDMCKNMTLVGIVGIKDPMRPGVPEAVRSCQKAGVVVRMVTGDNRLTGQAIARDCGILQSDSVVMEGPEFRNLTEQQQLKVIPNLHVLARSSPEDKRILVKRLKSMGAIVAVTGDGTNDAPALKSADVGFSMGIAGTEVAKEASDIILMDDDFASIVKALKWGRAVNDAVKRFLQFQLTVNITAVVLTFVSSMSSDTETSVLTAVQLLWVNLIMDTLAALALATDPPHESVLDRKPIPKNAFIISVTMWKMILGQAIYQLLITLLLYFGRGRVIPRYTPNPADDLEIPTLIFNTFVWMQIFNQWNNRRLDNKLNIFEGLSYNWIFIAISCIMCGCQVIIIELAGIAFGISTEGLSGSLWAVSIVLGAISVPVGALIRLIPDRFMTALVPGFVKRWLAHTSGSGVTVDYDDEDWDPLSEVREELAFLKRVKGGRLNNLKFAMRHPRSTMLAKAKSPGHSRASSIQGLPQTLTRDESDPTRSSVTRTPESRARSRSNRSRSNSALGAATVMSGIVAGSIAGWSPIDRRGERDFADASASSPPGRSRSVSENVSEGEIKPSSEAQVPTLSVPQMPRRPSL